MNAHRALGAVLALALVAAPALAAAQSDRTTQQTTEDAVPAVQEDAGAPAAVPVTRGEVRDVEGALEIVGLSDLLQVVDANGNTVITGEVQTIEQYLELERVAVMYPEAKLLVKVDRQVLEVLADRINAAFAAMGAEGAKARLLGSTLVLEGTVADEAERDRAERIARAVTSGYRSGAEVDVPRPRALPEAGHPEVPPEPARGEPGETLGPEPVGPEPRPVRQDVPAIEEAPATEADREAAPEAELGRDRLAPQDGIDAETEIGPERHLEYEGDSGL